ncbi:MAG: iron-containing alcohol dehydrogenase, partial [Clostridia bacterium]|nr:iron-containing alcohol dehydrogenase [Clostridia bacterium]
YCRAYQLTFRAILPLLPYREPEIVGSCSELCSVFAKENVKSALIVTGKGSANNRRIAPVEEALNKSGVSYAIFSGVQPNPTIENVEEGVKLYCENNCDCIIAFGGGSAIDCAKVIGARIAYPKKTVGRLKGLLRIMRKIPTLIAIPTTAGSGSEVTPAAIITDSQKQHKYALMSFPLIPHYAVLDASLTYSLPQSLTATTGMDALTHAVEAYIGRSTTKQTRQLALEATALIFENIEKAYIKGNDHLARENLLHASYKAGIAFSKSYVGYIHAISHSVSGIYGTPHGLANAVIMPYVLEAYGKSAYKKLHRLGIAAGVCTENDSHKLGAEKFITAIKDTNAKIGIPDKITGIKKEDISVMVCYAEREANPLYPVPRLMTKNQLEALYYQIGE